MCRSSAPLYRARAAKSATLHDIVFFLLVIYIFCFYYRLIPLSRRESSARVANRATSGANGADESERSDGPNERSVRSGVWMERMERVAPPFRYVLSSSSCRRAGGGVTMWNLCLRRMLRAPTNIFFIFLSYFRVSVFDTFHFY